MESAWLSVNYPILLATILPSLLIIYAITMCIVRRNRIAYNYDQEEQGRDVLHPIPRPFRWTFCRFCQDPKEWKYGVYHEQAPPPQAAIVYLQPAPAPPMAFGPSAQGRPNNSPSPMPPNLPVPQPALLGQGA